MISEFVFFMSIAAICFSGLLFTLWTLGTIICLNHLFHLPTLLYFHSIRQMDYKRHRLAYGSNLVRQHLFEFRPGVKFSSILRTDLNDIICLSCEYSSFNELSGDMF